MGSQITNKFIGRKQVNTLLLNESSASQSIIRLSKRSLIELQKIDLKNMDEFSDRQYTKANTNTNSITLNSSINPSVLKPIRKNMRVVGIDVSNIKIGETETGTLHAFRGSIVYKENNVFKLIRCGPLIFHLNDMATENNYFSEVDSLKNSFTLSKLRNIFERNLQLVAAKHFKNSILLLDGSLTAGSPDNHLYLLKDVLETARYRNNIVIAISKSSKLSLNGRNITYLVKEYEKPCFINIDPHFRSLFHSYPIHLMGWILVAKLSNDAIAFRIDIDKVTPSSSIKNSLGLLMHNELLKTGYPETLRIAHIQSILNETEIIAIHSFLARKYNFQEPVTFNLRKLLFGPFSSGCETIQ